MAVSRQKNAAFTLVEMLVVITILGVLMSLILPAVNSVREAMRRTQCKNNLKQMGVAANAHVAQYGFFPSAGWGMKWLGDPDCGAGAHQPGSWIYQLLPFMGLDMIHDLGKGLGNENSSSFTSSAKYTGQPNPPGGGPQMRYAAVPVFNCPTRRRSIVFPDVVLQGSWNAQLPSPPVGLNHSDYCANTGTWEAGDAFGGDPNCMSVFPNCAWDDDAKNGDGVVFQASQVTPGLISDGLANTFFAGEKWLGAVFHDTSSGLTHYGYYASTQAGDDNSMMEGFDHDIIRWTGQNYPPAPDTNVSSCYDQGGNSWWCPNQDNAFGSAHSAGVNFVYCDGSVRLISYSINLTIYTSLGCRNYAAANNATLSENY